ncbi:helix-turn-helix domain-containing protein [Streptomyces jeddahensis]
MRSLRPPSRRRCRLEAAQRFAAGATNGEVAKDIRVSVRSVHRWHRVWQEAGADGSDPQGPSPGRG